MLNIQKLKYKKIHLKKKIKVGQQRIKKNFGYSAIVVLNYTKITSTNCRDIYQYAIKTLGKTGKFWFTPPTPIIPATSKKKNERMGKGCGVISSHFYFINSGKALIEFESISKAKLVLILEFCKKKLKSKLKLK